MTTKLKKTPPEDEKRANAQDVVLVHGRTQDGRGLEVLRKKGDALLAGEVRPLEEGKSIAGEVVRLSPRKDAPLLCDVEVVHHGPQRGQGSGKPAQVSSDAYRSGWRTIWGSAGRQRPRRGESSSDLN